MVRFNFIAVFLYLFPAFLYLYLNNLSDLGFYENGLNAILYSIFFTIFGFSIGNYCSTKIRFNLKDFHSSVYLFFSKVLLVVAVLSVSFQLVKHGVPLFNNDVREYIQQGFFWNVYTFSSMLGLFFLGYYYFSLGGKGDWFSKSITLVLMLLTLLTGWKGVLINFLLIFFCYSILYKKIKFLTLFKIFVGFFVIFFGVNAIRSGVYSISFLELFNYLFYGFENFVRISSNYYSTCLHSIPIFGCSFTYDNNALINPTFNVYTALMPLYSDGGVVLVSLFFFFLSFLIGLIKDYKNSLFFTFLFYVLHYFFLIAHNGYIFNSGSFVIILIFLFFVDFVRIKNN